MRDDLNSSNPNGEERSRLVRWRAVALKVLRWVATMILPVLSGLVGLGSLNLPWVLAIGRGWDGIGGSRFERIWGVDLLSSYWWDARPALLLMIAGCLLCLFTPLLTRKPERRHFRSLLYGFYAFLGVLTILDVENWIAIPRCGPIGGTIMFSEIGLRFATYAIIGMSISALAAFLEKRPGRPSPSSLFIGVSSGISVLYTFFNVDWVIRSWSGSSGYGLSGFVLAFDPYHNLNWLGSTSRDLTWLLMNLYSNSLFLYTVPILAVLAMLIPFMKLKWNLKIPLERALHIFIGALLFLMGCLVSVSASGYAIHQGLNFLMATGIFLAVSQSVIQVCKGRSSREQQRADALG